MSDVARFLAALADSDAEGITSDELIAYLEQEHVTAGDLLRLRIGCVVTIAAIDKLIARRRAARAAR